MTGVPPAAPRIVVLWSAPRCRSTAFARMMLARGDLDLVHEPFSHVTDFGTTVVGGRVVHSRPAAMAALLEHAGTTPVFVKDTTDFRYGDVLADAGFLRRCRHSFLIREPAAAIASHARLVSDLGRDEIGFAWLHETYERVVAATGQRPTVLDSDELLAAPERAVRAYCRAVGLPFVAGALRWAPGMLAQWEPSRRWHADAAASTGFRPAAADPAVVAAIDRHPTLGAHYRHHLPHYRALRERRLRF